MASKINRVRFQVVWAIVWYGGGGSLLFLVALPAMHAGFFVGLTLVILWSVFGMLFGSVLGRVVVQSKPGGPSDSAHP